MERIELVTTFQGGIRRKEIANRLKQFRLIFEEDGISITDVPEVCLTLSDVVLCLGLVEEHDDIMGAEAVQFIENLMAEPIELETAASPVAEMTAVPV